MIKSIREKYNNAFTQEVYHKFLHDFDLIFNKKVEFRIAETPVFIDRNLSQKLTDAGAKIISQVLSKEYIGQSEKAIPKNLFVPNENPHTDFLAIDFAICKNESDEFVPQLIELQGFASLFYWQDLLPQMFRKYFNIPEGFSHYFNNFNCESYWQRMREVIIGNHNPENVILLEIEPDKQKTWIDFYGTKKMLGIEPVCISKIIRHGKKLFYEKNGKQIAVHRIYNRVIFDEFVQRSDLKYNFNMTDEVDTEWAGHPNWFFRLSKYAMPYLKNKYSPSCYFLDELKTYPPDLENYVLKPLFSFAGSGVIIDVKKDDLDRINNRDNYILQKKVNYAPAFVSPTGPVKVEVRLLYTWKKNDPAPTLMLNMARLSKGAMIGVSHNKNKDWVGGSVGLFENFTEEPL